LIDLPFLGTWKEIRNWSSTGRRLEVLLKRPDGCKLAQKLLDTVWGPEGMNTSSGRMMLVCLASGWDDTSSWRMEQWTDGCPDGMARSSGRLIGNLKFFWLAGRNDSHHSESGIHVYRIFTLKWFCPNTEWGQNTNICVKIWGATNSLHKWNAQFHYQLWTTQSLKLQVLWTMTLCDNTVTP
jgi:hypothetical protein